MTNDNIESQVVSYFEKELPIVTTFFLKKIPVTLDSILQDDLVVPVDEAYEIAYKFFDHFQIKHDQFDINNYYPWNAANFLRKALTQQPIKQKNGIKPLTIKMFAESAKAGRWLYN